MRGCVAQVGKFELQLAEFDIELPGLLLLASSSWKSLRALCCEVTVPERAEDDEEEQGHVGTQHQHFSATRITALRARGLMATSAALGLRQFCRPAQGAPAAVTKP